jgi:site-specific recombinase XerD
MRVIFVDIPAGKPPVIHEDRKAPRMPTLTPCLIRSRGPAGDPVVRLGQPLLDDYLEFLSGRCRPNTVLAVAFDLKVFFTVVGKHPRRVRPSDVLAFMTAQRTGEPAIGGTVVPVGAEQRGVSTRTLRRRLSSISGLFGFLQVRGDVATNPVPRGLPTRIERQRPHQGVPLVRTTRTLPRILTPAEVDALTLTLRTHRDQAMVAAMVLGGLRRCEVIGLRLGDLRVAEKRVFIADGKGGHQRLVPISRRFFDQVSAYLDSERPADAGTDQLFVVLKRPRRGQPLTAAGVDEVLDGARRRSGLAHATCHELRHTCLTRLREAGMALEAVQAQAGHASIESTRIYLHLADDWLASQYRKAAEAIDAQVFADHPMTPVTTPPAVRSLR